jgi:hypothetical protein
MEERRMNFLLMGFKLWLLVPEKCGEKKGFVLILALTMEMEGLSMRVFLVSWWLGEGDTSFFYFLLLHGWWLMLSRWWLMLFLFGVSFFFFFFLFCFLLLLIFLSAIVLHKFLFFFF